MSETTPLIKAALNLRVGAGFDVYKQSETVRILRVSSGRNPGTYGRYRPVIPGTIIALVTGASGKNQKTKVNVSRESGIYLSRYLIWCVYGKCRKKGRIEN